MLCLQEVRLQDGADVVVTGLAQAPVDAEGRLDPLRLLHVDADEVVERGRFAHEPLDVAVRDIFAVVEAEMGELEDDVGPKSFDRDSLEDRLVRLHDPLERRLVVDMLAKERGVRREPLLVQTPQDGDGLVERLAGDEAGCAEAHPEAVDEPPDDPVRRGGENRAAEHGGQRLALHGITELRRWRVTCDAALGWWLLARSETPA